VAWDSLFVPGLTDLDIVTSLVQMSPLPINVMAGPGAPTIAEFEAAGVRRVSVGTAISQAAYGLRFDSVRGFRSGPVQFVPSEHLRCLPAPCAAPLESDVA
jgi:2-methylisocitrate lyase-like PEP mutase family enzyme